MIGGMPTLQTARPTNDRNAGTQRQWWVLAGLLAASFGVAYIGGLSSTTGVDGWYAAAEKP